MPAPAEQAEQVACLDEREAAGFPIDGVHQTDMVSIDVEDRSAFHSGEHVRFESRSWSNG
jgi:hypothetical protein